MSYSKDEKDWLGREQTNHYDEKGNKIGHSKEETNWLGNDKSVHYDSDGNEIGVSKNETNWRGEEESVHFDQKGNKTGYSKKETDWQGKTVIQHYDKDGKNTGESKYEKDWRGQTILRHFGKSGEGNSGLAMLIGILLVVLLILGIFSYPYKLIDSGISPFGFKWLGDRNVWIFCFSLWTFIVSSILTCLLVFSDRGEELMNEYLVSNGFVRILILLISMPFVLLYFIKSYFFDSFYLFSSLVFLLILIPLAFLFWKTSKVGSTITAYVISSAFAFFYIGGEPELHGFVSSPVEVPVATADTTQSLSVLPQDTLKVVLFDPSIDSYVLLKGNIGGYPITMNLQISEHEYRGSYYFDKYEEPIDFEGNDTELSGNVQLVSHIKDWVESFVLERTADGFTGYWQKNEGESRMDVILKKQIPPHDFIYYKLSKETLLSDDLSESPKGIFSFGSLICKDNNPDIAPFNNKINENLQTDVLNSGNIESLVQNKLDYEIKNYRNSADTLSVDEIKDNPSSFSVENQELTRVIYNSNNLVTIEVYSYGFYGGAHGDHSSKYIVYDLLNKGELTSETVFIHPNSNKLISVLERQLKMSYNLSAAETLQDAGFFEEHLSHVSTTFCVTGKGILFVYPPYEIAPYSSGEIKIFVPYGLIADELRTSFKQLMELQ